MLIMTTTKKIIKTLLLLVGTGTALAALDDVQQVSAADATAGMLADVVETNKSVNDGEVLAARETLMAKDIDAVPNLIKPNNKIEIKGTGTIQIGDENTTGVLKITGATQTIENVTPSITQTSISVTGDMNKKTTYKVVIIILHSS